MKSRFEQLAAYNKWANARLYEAAFALPDTEYRRDVGAFFKSLHGTLNHVLVGDRIWMKRLTGEGTAPNRLDAILHEDRPSLARARADEDERIIRYVTSLDDAALASVLKYATTAGIAFDQPRADVLSHFFNHQTHHRGQAHTILSIVTRKEPPSLDMLQMQRGIVAPDLRALAAR